MQRKSVKGSYTAPAIEKAFTIIELLSTRPDGAMVSEIAADLGRSVGELFRIVIVLEQLGYLSKSSLTDRYTVAYKFLDLAYRATPVQNLVRAALTQMPELAHDTGQSCHLVVPSGAQGLVVAREENPGTRGFALRVGAPIDLLQSCSGHVILAFSSADERDRMIDLAQAARDVPLDRAALIGKLDGVRNAGIDSRASPITYGVTDISVPVFGLDGVLRAALTIPFLDLIDGSQKMELAAACDRLRAAATGVSAQLGYRPNI